MIMINTHHNNNTKYSLLKLHSEIQPRNSLKTNPDAIWGIDLLIHRKSSPEIPEIGGLLPMVTQSHHWDSWNVNITSWWFQPIWKNISQIGFIFPKFRGENKKSLKPPPRSIWTMFCCRTMLSIFAKTKWMKLSPKKKLRQFLRHD